MAKRDFYDVLGVGKDASPDQLKSAYRKLAVKYHPDKNPGDKIAEDKFKEASEAYGILSDKEKTELIFKPGFSTADNVTEISGRGVGMDVVQKNIQSLGGRIEIETKSGEGTTFFLIIPSL